MTNKYVVAYLSLFDGNMQIEFVEAETDVEAALDFLKITDHPIRVSLPSVEEIDGYVSNQDAFISVRLLPN